MIGFLFFLGFTVFPFSIYLIVSKIQEIVHNKDNAEKERWECRNRQKELDSFERRLKDNERRLYLQESEFDKKQKEELLFYQKSLENLQFVFYNTYPISTLLDGVVEGRLNNAFGSELSFSRISIHSKIHSIHDDGKERDYNTSLTECDCGSRQQPCKHRLFLAYSLGILQVNREDCRLHYDKSVERITANAPLPKNKKAAAKAVAKNESLKS